ncbi:hypothetical protein DFP72DRAFT_884649 [Ephemerocybe angulata]|uniref:Uncharacterized protein n=1 Tax=Ephemerocybe angulata TaxID=980116 RepID=A0A8H6I6V7_9AGAR|nr:hypothetical protein DFP72DRAFT_884649 [Tulosesus angulatus]
MYPGSENNTPGAGPPSSPSPDDNHPSAESVENDIIERLCYFYGYAEHPGLDRAAAEAFAKLGSRQHGAFLRNVGWDLSRPGVAGFLKSPRAPAVWKFASLFTTPEKPAKYGASFDLDPACPMYLGATPLPENLVTVERDPPLKPFYALNTSEPGGYILAFDCPSIALAAGRIAGYSSGENTMLTLLHTLHRYGCRFYTLLPTPSPVKCPPPPKPLLAVPERPVNYKFDRRDYEGYQEILASLLQLPRMRAAGMRGGYVWRLTREYVSFGAVFDGPKESSAQVIVREATEDKQSFVDDVLLENDIALIVGTYKVAGGRDGKGIMKSWWPSPETDEDVGEFSGTWNNFLEVGFQARLRAIKAGDAQPLSVSEWRKLKGWKGVRMWRKRLAEASKELFL